MKIIKSLSWNYIIISLIILLLLSIIVFSTIGSSNIKISETFRIVLSKVPVLNKYINVDDISNAHKIIILKIRIPRVILGVLVGAALSSVGAAFQGMLKNPMADPYIIGVSSGAAIGATIVIVAGIGFSVLGLSSISVGAFIGATFATFLVYMIAKVKNKVSVTTLILSGVAVSQFLTAIMSLIMVIHSNDISKIIYWTLGSLSGKGWSVIKPIWLPIFVCIIILYFFSRDLNIMLTSEESAKSLGVEVEKVKIVILTICAFITALVVSVSGIIGFVGLIIPHIVRIIVGPDHRILIPASALFGAIFMVFSDTLARVLISPTEIPVGIITALFGGPFFIYLLINKKRAI